MSATGLLRRPRFHSAVLGFALSAMPLMSMACPAWEDVSLKLCDAETGGIRWQVKSQAWLPFVAVSADGKTIVTASSAGEITYWDPATGAQLRTATLSEPRRDQRRFTFSPDLRWVFEGGYYEGVPDEDEAVLWHLESGKVAERFGPSRNIRYVAFTADSKRIFLLTSPSPKWSSGGAYWIDLADRSRRAHIAASIPGLASEGSLAGNGRRLITSEWNGAVHVIDLANGGVVRKLERHTRGLGSVAFLPARDLAITLGFDRRLVRWDADGRAVWTSVVPRADQVEDGPGAIALSPDGRLAVTGAFLGHARMWDAATGQLLATIPGPGRWRPAFLPDGRSFVLAGTGSRPSS